MLRPFSDQIQFEDQEIKQVYFHTILREALEYERQDKQFLRGLLGSYVSSEGKTHVVFYLANIHDHELLTGSLLCADVPEKDAYAALHGGIPIPIEGTNYAGRAVLRIDIDAGQNIAADFAIIKEQLPQVPNVWSKLRRQLERVSRALHASLRTLPPEKIGLDYATKDYVFNIIGE